MLVEVVSESVAAQLPPASAWKITLCSKCTLTQRCYTPLADRAMDKTQVSALFVALKRARALGMYSLCQNRDEAMNE